MRYNSLHDLISASRTSREYFLSLPVSTQLALHTQNEHIRSLQELHRQADMMSKYDRAVKISESLF